MKNSTKEWTLESKTLATKLHEELRLNHENWHLLKNDPQKRAAELISSALLQILNGGEVSEIEEILLQSIRWINEEIKDPGCPNKKVTSSK